MKKMALSLVAVVSAVLLAPCAFGQTQTKLLASDGARDDNFGESVSISGDTALVGAQGDDDNGGASGSAYIFEQVGGAWVQQAKLLASDGQEGDEFGFSVSISGDIAIVGAPFEDENGDRSGSAYIFQKVGGIWTQTAKLVAADGEPWDLFGLSVSISGDTAIVGVSYDDDNGYGSGSAYVFEKVDGIWTEVAKLLASDGAASDFFGLSISISGNTALVGASLDDDLGSASGAAYVCEWSACNAADFAWPMGKLDFFDLQAFLNCFATNNMRADLTGDSLCDFFDVQMFLDTYAAGCP